jgi:ribosomal protein L7/L12
VNEHDEHDEQRYDVIVHGFSPERVRSALEGLVREFGLDPAAAITLVQRLPRVVKASQDYESAERYRFALEALGATVELRPIAERTHSSVPFGHTPSIAPSLPPRPTGSVPPMPHDGVALEQMSTRWLDEPEGSQAPVELAVPMRSVRSTAPPPDEELRGHPEITRADLWLMAVHGDSAHAADSIARLLHLPLRDAMEAVQTAPRLLGRNMHVSRLREICPPLIQAGVEVKLRKSGSMTSMPPPSPDDSVLSKIARWPWRKHPR